MAGKGAHTTMANVKWSEEEEADQTRAARRKVVSHQVESAAMRGAPRSNCVGDKEAPPPLPPRTAGGEATTFPEPRPLPPQGEPRQLLTAPPRHKPTTEMPAQHVPTQDKATKVVPVQNTQVKQPPNSHPRQDKPPQNPKHLADLAGT